MTVADRPTVPCDLVVGPAGMAVAWQDPFGPSLARLPRASSHRADERRLLGEAPMPVDARPRLAMSAGAVHAAWIQPDGVFAGADREPPRRIGDVARALAVAAGPRGGAPVVAILDEDGVVLVDADGPTRRVVERRSLSPRVELAVTAGGIQVLYAEADEPVLGVVHVDGGRVTEVRHRLPGIIADLHGLAVRTRVAVAMTYRDRPERADLAVLDTSGRMRERPHAALRLPGGRVDAARLCWVDTSFVLLAVDAATGALRVQPVGDDRGVELVLGPVRGPLSAAYFNQQLVVAQIEAGDDAATLRVLRCDRRGESRDAMTLDVTPAGTVDLRRRIAASRALETLRMSLSPAGYRSAAAPLEVDDRGASLVLRRDPVTVRLRVEHGADGARVELVADTTAGREAPAPSSLIRLSQWVKQRVSRRARELAEEDRAWAEARASEGGLSHRRLDRAGGTLSWVLHGAAIPGEAILRALVDALRGRLLAAPAEDRDPR